MIDIIQGLAEACHVGRQRNEGTLPMNASLAASVGLVLAITSAVSTAHDPSGHASPYAGLETRAIKSLSDADLDELHRGGGWGFALAAELNGIPGPAHLLELHGELSLSSDQVRALQAIVDEMRAEAIEAGARLIAAEEAIEAAFRAGGLDDERLRAMIAEAEDTRAELRFIHLSRHLDTLPLLSREQIAAYSRLRGYELNPCVNVPEGHDAEMWRRHNNCG